MTETEQEACAACPAGKYSPILGATSIAMCLMCPDFSSSPPGSSSVCDCSWEEFSRKPVPTIQKREGSSDDSDTCDGESVKIVVSGVAPVVLTLDGSEPDCKHRHSAKLS